MAGPRGVEYRAHTTLSAAYRSASSTWSISRPSTYSTGNMFLFLVVQSLGGASDGPTAPSGWTALPHGGGYSDVYPYYAVYGTDITGTSWTFTQTYGTATSGCLFCIGGDWSSDTALTQVTAVSQSDIAETNFVCPSTSVTEGDWFEAGIASRYLSSSGETNSWTVTSGGTERAELIYNGGTLGHSAVYGSDTNTTYRTLVGGMRATCTNAGRGLEASISIGLPVPPGPSFTRDGIAGTSMETVDGVSAANISTVDGVSA